MKKPRVVTLEKPLMYKKIVDNEAVSDKFMKLFNQLKKEQEEAKKNKKAS